MRFRHTTVSQSISLSPSPLSQWALALSDMPGPSCTRRDDEEMTDVATLVSDDSSSYDSASDDDQELVASLVAAGFGAPRRRFATPPNVAAFPPDADPVQNAPRRPTRTAARRSRANVLDHDLTSAEEDEINVSPLTGPIRNSSKRRTRFAPTTAHTRFQQSLSDATRRGVHDIRHQLQQQQQPQQRGKTQEERDAEMGRRTKQVFTSFFNSLSDASLGSLLRNDGGDFIDDLMSQVRRSAAPLTDLNPNASSQSTSSSVTSTPRKRRTRALQREPTVLFDIADGQFWDPRPEGHRTDEPLFGVTTSTPPAFLNSPIKIVEKERQRKTSLRREKAFIWTELP